MAVYGNDTNIINSKIKLNPKTHYAKLKLMAENLISKLIDSNFSVIILRPPIVYGKNSKDNYSTLSRPIKIYMNFPEYQ
jgi:UDP-glucose 4-epimerase